jgi:hypothetical protein
VENAPRGKMEKLEWNLADRREEIRRAGGLTATNVPGRKNIVRRAMAFIAEESRLLSRAMSLL